MLWIVLGISIVIFVLYGVDIARNPLPLKRMLVITIFSAASFVLFSIQFITYPQGGGISLFGMLPILLVGIIYGRRAGMTAGMLVGLLTLLNRAYIVHPVQLIVDYLLCTMMLGLGGIFGNDKRFKIVLGSFLAVLLSVFCNFISGIIFFGQFAPEGMNVWLYSFVYNFSSAGIEGLLTILLLSFIPIQQIIRMSDKY